MSVIDGDFFNFMLKFKLKSECNLNKELVILKFNLFNCNCCFSLNLYFDFFDVLKSLGFKFFDLSCNPINKVNLFTIQSIMEIISHLLHILIIFFFHCFFEIFDIFESSSLDLIGFNSDVVQLNKSKLFNLFFGIFIEIKDRLFSVTFIVCYSMIVIKLELAFKFMNQ